MIQYLPTDFYFHLFGVDFLYRNIDNKQRCLFLEHILNYGQISPMDNIISEFKSISSVYLSQLANEVNIYRSSSKERTELIDFAHFLHNLSHEIEDMLIIRH